MNIKVILSTILVSGFLTSSAQAFLPTIIAHGPSMVYSFSILSTHMPIIGPLQEESKIPQDEINNHLYSQAVLVANNKKINDTANFIAAMSAYCQISEKAMAQVVIQLIEANPTAELTCPSPQN